MPTEVNQAFKTYLELEIQDKTTQLEKAEKSVKPNNSILVVMKCELNKIKEINSKYAQFTNG